MPTTTACFSAILRRLLCRTSLPTHPSDEITDTETPILVVAVSKCEENTKRAGVVARLMGLDTLPSTPLIQYERGNTLGSFFRSKSANSVDFGAHLEVGYGHRRVRSSVSFHEGTYDDDCYYYYEDDFLRHKIYSKKKKKNINGKRGSGNVGTIEKNGCVGLRSQTTNASNEKNLNSCRVPEQRGKINSRKGYQEKMEASRRRMRSNKSEEKERSGYCNGVLDEAVKMNWNWMKEMANLLEVEITQQLGHEILDFLFTEFLQECV